MLLIQNRSTIPSVFTLLTHFCHFSLRPVTSNQKCNKHIRSHKAHSVFLDISKAFEKVWHEELIHKLPRKGVCGKLLQLSLSFLDSRKQQV